MSAIKLVLNLIEKINKTTSKRSLNKYKKELNQVVESGNIDLKRLNEKFKDDIKLAKQKTIEDKVTKQKRQKKYGKPLAEIITTIEKNPGKVVVGTGVGSAAAANRAVKGEIKPSDKKPINKKRGGMVTKWESKWG